MKLMRMVRSHRFMSPEWRIGSCCKRDAFVLEKRAVFVLFHSWFK